MGSKDFTACQKGFKKARRKKRQEFDKFVQSESHIIFKDPTATNSKELLRYRCGSQCVASDSTFLCSHGIRRTPPWLHFISPVPRLYYQQYKHFCPPLGQKCLPQQSFTDMHEGQKTPPRHVLSGKPCKLKQALKIEYWIPVPFQCRWLLLLSLKSFGFHICHIWRRHLEKPVGTWPLISLTLMMNSREYKSSQL